MSTSTLTIGNSVRGKGRALTWALWVAQLLVVGILGMAAFTKFFMYRPTARWRWPPHWVSGAA